MNILIFGNGMYVAGRGTNEYGTIVPGIIEFQRTNNIVNKVIICGRTKKNLNETKKKINSIQKKSGVSLNFIYKIITSNKFDETIKKIKKELDIDCSFVVVPDNLHYQIGKACLKNNLHSMIVKPVATKVSHVKELLKISKKNHLYCLVEFHKRFDRQNIILKDYYIEKKLGDILYTFTEYSQRKIIPTKIFKRWIESTNLIQYLGVHYIDIIRFVTGGIPSKVSAVGQKSFLIKKKINAYDSIQLNIEWKDKFNNKFNQTILLNWIDPNNSSAMSDQKIKFICTKGRVELDQKKRGIKISTDNNNLIEPNPDFCKIYGFENGKYNWQGYGIDSIKNFLNDLILIKQNKQKLKELEAIRPNLFEGLISTAVIEAANKSLKKKGFWVPIKF